MQDNNQDICKNGEESTTSRTNVVAIVMGVIMVAVYMGMSFLLLFTTFFQGSMPVWVRYVMGVVFFVYGIFRGYRVYKSRK